MVWTRKAEAPQYVNVGEAARALIEGTADSWMTPWLYLLGGRVTSVDAACALGPPDCAAFTELDFLGALTSGNIPGAIVNFASLAPKLNCFMDARLFSAYCEQTSGPDPSASWRVWDANACGTGPDVWDCVIWAGQTPLPHWVTALRLHVDSGGGATLAFGVSFDVPLTAGWAAGYGPNNVTASGYGDRDRGVGGEADQDIAGYQNGTRNLYPYIVRRGGTPPAIVPYCCTLSYYGASPGGTSTYSPPPVDRPPSAIDPPAGDYPDVAALGVELDNIERKLEMLLEQGIRQEIDSVWPLTEIDAPVSPANDDDLELGDARGFIVTISNPGIDVDENFGTPVEFSGLGRVVLGTGTAWLPPIPITVSPLLLVNLPPEVTVCRVHVYAPATFTITRLRRAAPQG